ncbi:unnamed protein product [Musa acuminata subsp. burmannicoides]
MILHLHPARLRRGGGGQRCRGCPVDVPSPSGRIRVRVQRRCIGPEGDGGGGGGAPGAVDEASAGAADNAVIAVPPPRPTRRPHVGVLFL